MKKLLLPIIAVVVLAIGIGATFGVLHFMHSGSSKTAAKPVPVVVPPKPIFFAQLPDVVVTIPPDTGQPASSYVQLGLQFATYDQNSLATFDELQPIIKADVINLMLSQTSAGLQSQADREALTKSCQAIVNSVMTKNANYTPANPFFAAYITNLVIQD
jgi:flagellar basal body-associated protein FliL